MLQEGHVMNLDEEKKAGLPPRDYEIEEVTAADGTKFIITKQKPGSDVGIYHPDTGKVERSDTIH
jgi:hypothetical protein